MTSESSTNTPGLFSLTPDGRVLVDSSGVYLADGRIQMAPGVSAVIGLQINDDGIDVTYYNAGSFSSGLFDVTGLLTINTTLTLTAGDTVSLVNVADPQFTLELLGTINNTGTPAGSASGAIRLVLLHRFQALSLWYLF